MVRQLCSAPLTPGHVSMGDTHAHTAKFTAAIRHHLRAQNLRYILPTMYAAPKKERYACVDTRFSKQMSRDDDVRVMHLKV